MTLGNDPCKEPWNQPETMDARYMYMQYRSSVYIYEALRMTEDSRSPNVLYGQTMQSVQAEYK